MKPLPSRPDIDQLKKQAKELLAAYRRGVPEASERFRKALPAAAGRDDDSLVQVHLCLRDAQSCIAREYGFASRTDLKGFVEAIRLRASDSAGLAGAFCHLVYAGDIAGGMNRGGPGVAARLLAEHPELALQSPSMACAVGDVGGVRRQTDADPSWVNRPGGELNLPPLVAATHSSLLRLPDYKDRLRETVDLLLRAGADPNQSVGSRWPPASLTAPSPDHSLSALYGAAGQNHDPELTKRLLAAGADPNDNESLYHSLKAPACTRRLLDGGAILTGTNALYRALDLDDFDTFRLRADVRDAPVPSMLLQPLIENAIKHGLRDSRRLELTVRAQRIGRRLLFEVRNNGRLAIKPPPDPYPNPIVSGLDCPRPEVPFACTRGIGFILLVASRHASGIGREPPTVPSVRGHPRRRPVPADQEGTRNKGWA